MRLAGAVLVVLMGGVLQAQQPPAPVTLDVVVDEGASRVPLTSNDFTVSDGGQALFVSAARLVQPSSDTIPLPPISTDEDELAAATVADRLVGIYIDEYHLADDEGFGQARTAVATFIRRELGPRDLVVVLRPLDSLVSIRMTQDRERAARIVEEASAREGDYTPRSAFEQNFIAGAPARIDDARTQITLSALNALASHLGRFPAGRKTLLVVSNGIAGRMPPRSDQVLPGLESVARTANRARVAVYVVRPSAGPAASVSAPRDAAVHEMPALEALTTLAERTTGFVIDGGGATAAGLQRVRRDAGRYYVLTLTPADGAADGRFRGVTVRVRAPGATVRARAGYAQRVEPIAARASSFPVGLTIPRHMSPMVRVWFGQAAASAERTRVEFVWEPAPRVPGERGPAVIPARVSLSVSTMDGTPVFSGVATASGRDGSVGLSEPAQLTFETAPGALLVQMEVLDFSGRAVDHDVRDLVVGGFPGPLTFGTAAIYRARTLRELRAIADGSGGATPVASRRFSRTEHLVVRIPVVSRGGTPTVTVRLQSGFGAPLGNLTVTTAGPEHNLAQVDVPLASLASGGYTLEFDARNSLGSALDRLEFVVTP